MADRKLNTGLTENEVHTAFFRALNDLSDAEVQALIDAGIPSGEIALVVASRPGVYALERAYKAAIPSMVIAKKGKTQEDFERELIAALD